MNRPSDRDRREDQSVEIVLALAAGVAVFAVLALAGWFSARAAGVNSSPAVLVQLVAGVAGALALASIGWVLVRARRRGL